MHLETQTRKLAQIVFLFSAISLCAILLCVAAATVSHRSVRQSSNFQVYTYQNPFSSVQNRAPATVMTKAGNILTRLATPQFLVGVSSLGLLWLASTLHLQDRKRQKHLHRKIIPVANPEPKMNPLAILPPLAACAQKEDKYCKNVFGGTTTLCSLTHRKLTAPCQSRFRPVSLTTSQTRFHRL